MNTASLSEPIRQPNKSLWTRFAWKEYRMLRGFWLAVLVLGVLEQWVSTLMMIDAHVIPGWLFTSAWGAAALYAVGAAVTLFGAENEERTRGFLQLLQGRWQPMFFAKLAVALTSSILLAGVLCLTGWLIAGGAWPSTTQVQLSLSVAGVAVVEALVWGLLFSLLWKQPLMAAVTAMAAASFGSQLAVLATPLAQDSFSAESYQAAVPMRLAICLVVFAIDVLLGSRWLAPLGVRVKRQRKKLAIGSLIVAKPQAAVAPWRRRMFARLLWQTWRESWKTILAAIGLGLFLTISSQGILETLTRISLPLTSLVLPALLGALVYRADQKRDHRLFLATHSARPRYVWLARQVVWLGALAILAGVVHWWVSHLTQELLITELDQHFHGYWGGSFFHWPGERYNTDWLWSWNLQRAAGLLNQFLVLGWCSLFAAYAVGQVCSLAFRREVLAGFLAILFSIVLAAWSMVVFAWQLNPLWFMLPIGVGAILATWLRIPDWLVGRKHLRSWLAPALVMCLPLLMFLHLPNARLAQMDLPQPTFPFLQEPLEVSMKQFQQAEIARNKFALLIEQAQENVSELVAVTQQADYCSSLDDDDIENQPEFDRRLRICRLLDKEAQAFMNQGDLDKAWQTLLAIVRIATPATSRNLATDQRILAWAQYQKQSSTQIKSAIADLESHFAALPHPREEILQDYLRTREVILDKELPRFANPHEVGFDTYLPFLANKLPWERERALIALDYLTTQALNYVDAAWKVSPKEFRELCLSTPWSMNYAINKIVFDKKWKDFERACALTEASRTSYLAAGQFGGGNRRLYSIILDWVQLETRHRALLIELALIAYRLDHGEYPAKLAELVPEYLAKMPADPYSGKAFQYRSEGLEFPLLYSKDGNVDLTEVPAETPLLWSVGIYNSQLVKSDIYDSTATIEQKEQGMVSNFGDEELYEAIIKPGANETYPPDLVRTIYYLRRSESEGFDGDIQVFVLPGDRNKQLELRE